TNHAVTEENPSDDSASGMQRHDHFRGEGIKSATHDCPLRRIGVRQVWPVDQMSVEFEPTHERIALPVLEFVSFRQTTQARAKAVAIALPDLGKNSYPSHAGRVGHIFEDRKSVV